MFVSLWIVCIKKRSNNQNRNNNGFEWGGDSFFFGERKQVFYICSACIMIAHEEGNKRKKADYKCGGKILRFSPKAIYWSIALHSKTLSNTKNKADLQQMIFAFNILHGLCFCPCCFVSECSTVST